MLILILALNFLPEYLFDLSWKWLNISVGEAMNEIALSTNYGGIDFFKFINFEIF